MVGAFEDGHDVHFHAYYAETCDEYRNPVLWFLSIKKDFIEPRTRDRYMVVPVHYEYYSAGYGDISLKCNNSKRGMSLILDRGYKM